MWFAKRARSHGLNLNGCHNKKNVDVESRIRQERDTILRTMAVIIPCHHQAITDWEAINKFSQKQGELMTI